jgi:hypothetical protein
MRARTHTLLALTGSTNAPHTAAAAVALQQAVV